MMKSFFKKIIVFIITLEAKMVLKKHRPKIVAVTGSVGKTSAKDAISAVLEKEYIVRKTTKSYNSEVGVPLVILGCENAWFNTFLWLSNILKGVKTLFSKEYPDWLILELGVERPKDMSKLVSWVKPHMAVMTALSDIPVHVEFFPNPEALMEEKAKIFKSLTADDFAVLNEDDEFVYGLKTEKIKARFITYGFDVHADLSASNYSIVLRKENGGVRPEGITFKIEHKGSLVPIRLFNTFGKHQVYAALAALAVGTVAGLNLVEMAESLVHYVSPPGRLKLIEGEKNTFILDDTYNSSPVAARAALEVLNDIPAKRKIAVLGDMLELGKYTIESHKAIGGEAGKAANLVFTVGPRAKFIAEALREGGFPKKNIFEFSLAEEAGKELEKHIEEGDLILIKGSQSMRLEKVVEEIMAHPEKAGELLVRQEKTWKNKK